MDSWKDETFVQRWDSTHFEGNPVRKEQLDIVRFLAKRYYKPETSLVDIGFGSGILEELLLKDNPSIKIFGIDSSNAMVTLAKKRLGSEFNKIEYVFEDLKNFSTVKLPSEGGYVAVSIQTIHNFSNEVKIAIFNHIYKWLLPGGIFIVMDRIKVYPAKAFTVYRTTWDYLEQKYDTKINEGDNYKEHAKRLEEKGDYPLTLFDHITLLEKTGFAVTTAHLVANRVVLVGVKS